MGVYMKNKKKIIIISSVSLLFLFLITFTFLLTYNNNIEIVKVSDPAQSSQKLLSAIKGDGAIDLTEAEANSIMEKVLKDGNISNAFLRLNGDTVKFCGIYKKFGINFLVNAVVYPYMENGSIHVRLQKLYVGKISIPKGVALSLMKKMLPQGTKLLSDGSLDIGNKLLNTDVDNLYVSNGKLYINLKQDAALAQANPTPTPTPTGQQGSPSSGTQTKEDPKVTALKKTNSQLYGVLNDVSSSQAKSWIQTVISINSKMIANPNGNYTSDVNGAKKTYGSLSADVRNEIKSAAMDNMDMSSVKYLVNEFGM
jgi:Uncharacterized protein conserved in bacteria